MYWTKFSRFIKSFFVFEKQQKEKKSSTVWAYGKYANTEFSLLWLVIGFLSNQIPNKKEKEEKKKITDFLAGHFICKHRIIYSIQSNNKKAPWCECQMDINLMFSLSSIQRIECIVHEQTAIPSIYHNICFVLYIFFFHSIRYYSNWWYSFLVNKHFAVDAKKFSVESSSPKKSISAFFFGRLIYILLIFDFFSSRFVVIQS